MREPADELTLELRLAHAWDLPFVTLDLAAAAGGGVLHQTFVSSGVAPPRLSATALVGIGGTPRHLLRPRGGRGVSLAARVDAEGLHPSDPTAGVPLKRR